MVLVETKLAEKEKITVEGYEPWPMNRNERGGGVLVLLMGIAQRVNRAMKRLSLASQAIADGNLSQQVSGSFIQELDVTANAFNQMGRELAVSYAKIKDYSNSLEEKVHQRTQALEQEVRDRTRSESTLRNLIANIPGTTYRCRYDAERQDTAWVMEFISDSIADLSGYPAEDFFQNRVRAYIDLVLPEDIERILKIVMVALDQRAPYVLEYRIRNADGAHSVADLRLEMQKAMQENCAAFRTGEVLDEGVEKIEAINTKTPDMRIEDRGLVWNPALLEALEYDNLIGQATVTVNSAANRKESRGAHAREDFDQRDDENWMMHTLAWSNDGGEVNIDYRPVHNYTMSNEIEYIKPKERVY